MSTRWVGATGRYQASCQQGHCALTGGKATSKHEAQIFSLLSYVIGPGQHDVRIWSGSTAIQVDMTLPLPSGRALAVEYDGAFWHQGREENDSRKADKIQLSGQYIIVRVREDPLPPLSRLDVRVPPRADATECVRLTLLHLVHELPEEIGPDAFQRIAHFLNASVASLESDRIACRICRRVACEIFTSQPLSRKGSRADASPPSLRRR